MTNLHAQHNAPRVLPLEIARSVRRVCTVLSVVKRVQAVVMTDVKSTLERVLSVKLDIMDLSVIIYVH